MALLEQMLPEVLAVIKLINLLLKIYFMKHLTYFTELTLNKIEMSMINGGETANGTQDSAGKDFIVSTYCPDENGHYQDVCYGDALVSTQIPKL